MPNVWQPQGVLYGADFMAIQFYVRQTQLRMHGYQHSGFCGRIEIE